MEISATPRRATQHSANFGKITQMETDQRSAILVVSLAHAADPLWSEQKQAIKGLMSGYDEKTKEWYRHFDLHDPPVDAINALFDAAKRYGTSVRIEAPPEASAS